MEIYNKKYVYFDWDDKLEGKKGFFGDNINHLKLNVKDNRTMFYGEICHNVNTNTDYPFGFIDELGSAHCFRFCYYDPYYEFRKAYLEGKQLQFKNGNGNWEYVVGEPLFNGDEYRIKPDDTWYIVLGALGVLGITKDPEPKHVYFTGTEEECSKWIDEHKHLVDIMAAWEDCKQIQFRSEETKVWVNTTLPEWNTEYEYRIKPEEKYVPFDTLDELIHKWEAMNPGCINRPKCAMPMIWIKRKKDNRISLIIDYYPDGVGTRNASIGTDIENLTFKDLFKDFTFIDDSIIGKRK